MDERRSYEEYFRDHLAIEDLKISYPYDHGRIEEIVELLVDTVCSTAKTIRCAGEDRPVEVVKSRFMKLGYLAGQQGGKNIWENEKRAVPNRELKSMVEFYKSQNRDSVLGQLGDQKTTGRKVPVRQNGGPEL